MKRFSLMIFLYALISTGCGQSSNSSVAKSEETEQCDTQQMTIGACLLNAGFVLDSSEWNITAGLMKNGNYSIESKTKNGRCYANIQVSGTLGGSSYSKSFSCAVNN